VADPRDIVDIPGVPNPAADAARGEGDQRGPTRKFLQVWFTCCHTYGRLYRNAERTKYEGRCPRCGAKVHAHIGPGGTSQRMFRTT
jgi:hypothetical protein